MTADVVGRERNRTHLRAPLTGLVLVLIVVFGTYYGWQAAFGAQGPNVASDGCPTPSATTTTPTPSTSAPTKAPTSAAVIAPAAAVTTVPTTTTPPPTGGPVLLPASVAVNVYNATLRRGLANNTAAELRNRGFEVLSVQNDPLEAVVVEVAQIRSATSDQPEVRLLVQHIPGAVLVPDGRTNATVDLVLGEAFTVLGDPALVTPVPIATPRC